MTDTRTDTRSPAELVAGFARARVLALGDVMLDRFAFGDVDRISPEAPIPVLRMTRHTAALGGAGNVLANLAALGARCDLVAAVGDDDAAQHVRALVEAHGAAAEGLVVDPGRRTTTKERFLASGQQILRADSEDVGPLGEATRARLSATAQAHCAECGVVVVSDYRKGVVTRDTAQALIAAARAEGARVVVDPKGADYSLYRGAYLVTPNARELHEATGMPTATDEEVVAACRMLIEAHELGGVLATRSERGMTLVLRDAQPLHLKAESQEVFDITGAGDTVIATLAAGLASGLDTGRAAAIANVAAGIVVRKRGTASVSPAELVAALNAHPTTAPIAKVAERLEDLHARLDVCRGMNLAIGFTNGCFDLLHPGHVAVLRQAREACDFLVVGLNSDESVKRLKGAGRPVQDARARATMLASLGVVDAVVVFDEDTPEALIRKLRPDVLVKGADYRREDVAGGAFVESYGGRIVLADLEAGFSTSAIIARSNGGSAGASSDRQAH